MSIELRTVGQLDTRRASYSTLTQGSGIGFVYVTKITFVTTEERYSVHRAQRARSPHRSPHITSSMHYLIINSRFGSKLLAARLPRTPPHPTRIK